MGINEVGTFILFLSITNWYPLTYSWSLFRCHIPTTPSFVEPVTPYQGPETALCPAPRKPGFPVQRPSSQVTWFLKDSVKQKVSSLSIEWLKPDKDLVSVCCSYDFHQLHCCMSVSLSIKEIKVCIMKCTIWGNKIYLLHYICRICGAWGKDWDHGNVERRYS